MEGATLTPPAHPACRLRRAHGPAVTCEGKAIDWQARAERARRLRGRGRLRSRTSGSECAMSTNDDNEPRVERTWPLAILDDDGR